MRIDTPAETTDNKIGRDSDPAAGEVLFIPEGQAAKLDMSVEQAVRILVSGGIAAPKKFLSPE